jgi:hypothetical protein
MGLLLGTREEYLGSCFAVGSINVRLAITSSTLDTAQIFLYGQHNGRA